MKLFVLRDYPYKKSDRTPQLPNSENSNIIFLSHAETQRRREHRERAIAPPQFPKSDRTPPTSQKRSHPLNFANSDRTSSTPQKAIAPPKLLNSDRTPSNFPKSDRTPLIPKQRKLQYYFFISRRDAENTEKERSHSLNFPKAIALFPQISLF